MPQIKSAGEKSLVLKGSATAVDLTSLRFLPADVETVDMSALSISQTTIDNGDYFGQREFKAGEIPAFMLVGTQVKTLQLPGNVTTIGDGAFAAVPLEKIDLKNASAMGTSVFDGCLSLRYADLSETSITSLPARTFYGCSALKDVSLPPSLKEIGKEAFGRSGIETLNAPGVEKIGDYAFAGASSLSEITFASGCHIGEGAFYGDTSLENLRGETANIPALFAAGSSLGGQTLTVNAQEVGEGAYSKSPSTVILLKEGVNKIDSHAFHAMLGLQSVDVTELGDRIPEADKDAFKGVNVSEIPLYVAKSTENLWKAAPVWKDFKVTSDTSSGGEITAVNEIMVERSGNYVSVASGAILTNVSVYSLDGSLISSVAPGSESYRIELPEDVDIVLVRAEGGNCVKVVKIVR